MLSSISSYIWGGEAENGPTEAVVAAPPALRDPSPVQSDWVLVGNQPGPGSLSGLEPLNTPSASEAPSEAGEENGQATPAASGGQQRAVRPANHEASVSLKHLKAAQISRQKNSGKALSSKALKRGNKAVVPCKKREVGKYNMSIKSAGFNKNLKQC